jgi:hypothetical protein
MSTEAQHGNSTEANASGEGHEIPADLWIGTGVVLLSVFLFFLAASGTLGGGPDEHGPTPGEVKAATRDLDLADEHLKAGRFLEAGVLLEKFEEGDPKYDRAREALARLDKAWSQHELDDVSDLIEKIGTLVDEGRFEEALGLVDDRLSSTRYRENVRDLKKLRADVEAKKRNASSPIPAPDRGTNVRPGAKPVDLDAERVLILPVDTWAFYSLDLGQVELSARLFTGCITAFAGSGVSLEPLRSLLVEKGLHKTAGRLANGADQMIRFHSSFDLSAERVPRKFREVPRKTAEIAKLAVEKLGLDFMPRFVFALAIEGLGKDKAGDRLKYRVMACLFDLQKRLVHSCAHFEGTIPMEKKPAMAEIAKIPRKAFKTLFK